MALVQEKYLISVSDLETLTYLFTDLKFKESTQGKEMVAISKAII